MPKRNFIWILAIAVAALATAWITRSSSPGVSEGWDELAPVSQTYSLIKGSYYKDVDEQQLKCSAVKGMVESLDAYSTYVPPEKVQAFSRRLAGSQSGIGLCLQSTNGECIVVGAFPGSPAQQAGLNRGDILLAVDGKNVTCKPLEDVYAALDGETGTQVRLTVLTRGSRNEISLVRSEFEIECVQGLYRNLQGQWQYLLEPSSRYAYVRVKEFLPETPEHLQRVLSQLSGLKGMVLDLRDNPGGTLASAVASSNVFLRQGTIVTSLHRGGKREVYSAQPDGMLPDLPLVVLVNGKTSSAAEIVAGALKINDRAVLVGSRTYGKGCVQSMIPLPGRLGQVNLTTAEFLIGEDQPISRTPLSERWGVDPHVEQPLPPQEQEALSQLQMEHEAVVPPVREQAESQPSTQPTSLPVPPARQMMLLDSQLSRAVSLLERPQQMQELIKVAAILRKASKPKAITTTTKAYE